MTNRNINDTQPQPGYPPLSHSDFQAAAHSDFQSVPHSDFQAPAYQAAPYPDYEQDAYAEAPYAQDWQAESSWYAEPQPTKKSKSWLWILLSIAIVIAISVLSIVLGYYSGIQQRVQAEKSQMQGSMKEQYDLALQDMQAQRFQPAQQRLEFILQHDPGYPEAAQKLIEVRIAMSATLNVPGPTLIVLAPPTQGATATPDTRAAEDLYNSAKQAMAGKNWSNAIDLLLKTRRQAPELNSIRVDSMLYIAYRSRGIEKISQAALEEGMYDISLAARYGPLDSEAQNFNDWANLYTVGASFWELDWGQAVQYFGQLAPSMPQLRDASGLSTIQRYQIALAKYGDTLAEKGDFCAAVEQYNLAAQSGNAEVPPTAVYAQEVCTSGETPAEGEATPEK